MFPRVFFTLSFAIFCTVAARATNQQQLDNEVSGFSEPPSTLPMREPGAQASAFNLLDNTGLLLIPDSSNDRIMAFDPLTGDLIDPDFIPADPDNLSTPIHAIVSSTGESILVSDQLNDVVQEYDLSGNYLGVFAPIGGADVGIMDNNRGISLAPNGNLLVSVGAGPNENAVAEFDMAGNFLGNRIASGADGLNSPFDVLLRDNNLLVSGISSDTIHQYSITGTPLVQLASIDTFPEQIAETTNSNILVANFSGSDEGILEYTSAGEFIARYNPATLGGYRGTYELPNGNILTTNSNGVHEIDRSGNLIETKITGVSSHFIEFIGGEEVTLPPKPSVPALNIFGLLLITLSTGLIAALKINQRDT